MEKNTFILKCEYTKRFVKSQILKWKNFFGLFAEDYLSDQIYFSEVILNLDTFENLLPKKVMEFQKKADLDAEKWMKFGYSKSRKDDHTAMTKQILNLWDSFFLRSFEEFSDLKNILLFYHILNRRLTYLKWIKYLLMFNIQNSIFISITHI